jgi:hypothetical protein
MIPGEPSMMLAIITPLCRLLPYLPKIYHISTEKARETAGFVTDIYFVP